MRPTSHPLVDQPMMDCSEGEKHRNRCSCSLRLPIGEHDDRRSELHRLGRFLTRYRRSGPPCPAVCPPLPTWSRSNGRRTSRPRADDRLQLGVGEDRAGQLDEMGLLRSVLEEWTASQMDAEDVTSFSRIGSIGGLVTWANCSWDTR